jgi:hypothetical protein
MTGMFLNFGLPIHHSYVGLVYDGGQTTCVSSDDTSSPSHAYSTARITFPRLRDLENDKRSRLLELSTPDPGDWKCTSCASHCQPYGMVKCPNKRLDNATPQKMGQCSGGLVYEKCPTKSHVRAGNGQVCGTCWGRRYIRKRCGYGCDSLGRIYCNDLGHRPIDGVCFTLKIARHQRKNTRLTSVLGIDFPPCGVSRHPG